VHVDHALLSELTSGSALDARLDAVEADVAVIQEAPLNVKDERFAGGAALDGVTDDWAALKAARDLAITAAKSEILIPPGVLLVNTPSKTFNPASGLTLSGEGSRVSTIKAGAGATNNLIGSGGAVAAGAVVEGLTVDCNGRGLVGVQIDTKGWTDFALTDVKVLNASVAGVNLVGALRPRVKGLYIDGVLIAGSGGVGLWLFNGTSDGDFEDIYVVNTQFHGIACDAGTTGGVVGSTADLIRANRFQGVHVEDAAGVGFVTEGGAQNTVDGMILERCGSAGLPGSGLPSLYFNKDQSNLTSDDNVVTGVVILDAPSMPVSVRSGSRNKVKGTANGIGKGGSNSPGVFLYAFGSGDACDDNDIELNASDTGGNFLNGALLRGEAGSFVRGNRVRGRFGRGSRGPTGAISSSAGSVIAVPSSGVDANVVDSRAPLTGRSAGQRGIKVPERPNYTTVIPAASRGYLLRVDPPERDIDMTKVAVLVSNPATANDDCAVALWDDQMAGILVASGATPGKMNVGGWQTIPLVYTLRAGTVYYVEFTYGLVGAVAATLIASNWISASVAYAFGQTFATGLEFDTKNTRHPPSAPYGALGGATTSTPLLVLREV
jgi:hypothetical protein